jgi:hypothetical protein
MYTSNLFPDWRSAFHISDYMYRVLERYLGSHHYIAFSTALYGYSSTDIRSKKQNMYITV